jgi:hypothetical protein
VFLLDFRSAVIDVKCKYRRLVVSRVNLKLKFRKNNYRPGSYSVGRLKDKNLKENYTGEFKI